MPTSLSMHITYHDLYIYTTHPNNIINSTSANYIYRIILIRLLCYRVPSFKWIGTAYLSRKLNHPYYYQSSILLELTYIHHNTTYIMDRLSGPGTIINGIITHFYLLYINYYNIISSNTYVSIGNHLLT